jgi:hypothetical protein
MNEKLKHKITKKTIVHCISAGQADYSLCGHDLAGDTEYGSAVRTTEKINCEDCINIINFCKRLPDNAISSKTINPYTWAGR